MQNTKIKNADKKERVAQLALNRAQLLLNSKTKAMVKCVTILDNNDFVLLMPCRILGNGYALKKDCLLISSDAYTALISKGDGRLIFDRTISLLNINS